LNLDRTRVRGVSFSADWKIAPSLTVNGQYLYDDARVVRSAVAPHLEGMRLAQVPRHAGTVGLTWRLGRWSLAPRVRWFGAQFEDDQNTLRLAAATIVDMSASIALSKNAELFVSAENLLDERVETGRAATGLVNIGTPRLLLVGARLLR
jgi:outer membrane receptor protein involved in Fe transport